MEARIQRSAASAPGKKKKKKKEEEDKFCLDSNEFWFICAGVSTVNGCKRNAS